MQDLRVGIVGANPDRSWAKDSHVPALQQLPGVRLAAVSTRREASARKAAETFGIEHWFTDPIEMVQSKWVDIVSVCVKVPDHRNIVLAALQAGKHVYCEWPLACNSEEARRLAEAGKRAGVVNAIGLQGRFDPAARQARELVENQVLGRPLTARILSTSAAFGDQLPSAYRYFNRADSGANLSTIIGGHTLDLASFVLGLPVEIDAQTAINFPNVKLVDTGEAMQRNTPDQITLLTRHTSGCVLAAEIAGARPVTTPFEFEIWCEKGRIALTGGDRRGFQAGVLTLEADAEFSPYGRVRDAATGGPAANVAELYAKLIDDIRGGGNATLDFGHAALLTQMIEAALETAVTGTRYRC